MVELARPADVRDTITLFANHCGILYALMAAVATTGVFLEPRAGAAVDFVEACKLILAGPDLAVAESAGSGLTGALSWATGLDYHVILTAIATPLFTISVFFSLIGLMASTIIVGRLNVLPEARIREFVLAYPGHVHTTGWFLIPSVASLGGGIVCAVDGIHGEPVTSIAIVGLVGLGLFASYGIFELGYATEKYSLLEKKKVAAAATRCAALREK